jgi:hypothetical protein
MIKMSRNFKTQASYGIMSFNDVLPSVEKIGRFAWEILDSLREAPAAPYKIDFTLVNITHLDTSKSIGVLDVPPIDTLDSPIYVTFSLRGKPDKYPRITVDQNSKTWHIWGTQNKKFLTLYFGRALVNKLNMQIVLDPDLRLLWNIVGSMTKNYQVNSIKDYAIPYSGVNQAHLYEQYLNQGGSYAQLIDHLPIQMWPYTQTFWEKCSYLFDRRLLPSGFETFWLLYLDPLVYLPNLTLTARSYVSSMCASALGDGFTVLSTATKLHTVPAQLGSNIVLLFVYALRALGIDVVGSNFAETEANTRSYIAAFVKACQELPDFNQQFILYLNQGTMSSMGLDLYEYTSDVSNTFLYLLNLSNKQYAGDK